MKKNIFMLFSFFLLTLCFAEGNDPEPLQNGGFTARQIISALKEAYPDKITEVSYRLDDWAVRVYDTWFYWAGGRLLPEDKILTKEKYTPRYFYNYPAVLPPFQAPGDAEKKRIEENVERRKTNPVTRDPGFQNSLWRITDRNTSWAQVKTTYFLGFKLQIHRDLLEDLARVEEDLQNRMKTDRELASFVRTLERVDGYNFRKIAGTETLSVHSYGTAVDLILKRTGGKQIYWLWTLDSGVKFYEVPYEKRFSPPLSFIDAFEKEGFIWGGKWLFYDTIHFEYRPEILILNGLMEK